MMNGVRRLAAPILAAASWTSSRIRQAMDPEQLAPDFVFRLLVFRVILLFLGARDLDASLAMAFQTCSEPWGMTQRLVLATQLLPLILNMSGILWPLLSMPTYEQHCKAFQTFLVCACSTAHMLQALEPLPWVQGSIRQHLLFDSLMIIIHQDPVEDLLPQLAYVQLVYNLGSLLVLPKSPQDSYLAMTTHFEFLLIVLLGVLFLHKLYSMMMGPRERIAMLQRQMRRVSCWGAGAGPERAQPWPYWHPIRLWQWLWPPAPQPHCSTSRLPPAGGWQFELGSAHLWKYLLIKAMHGSHFMLWHLGLAAGTFGGDAAGSGFGPALRLPGLPGLGELELDRAAAMSVIAALGSLALFSSALVAVLGGGPYARHRVAVNRVGLALCLACRLALLLLNLQSDNKSVFHNLLLTAFSVSAHEDSYPVFITQLGGLTVLFKSLSAYLGHRSGTAPFTLTYLLFTHPEYYLLFIAMAIIYPATMVGSIFVQKRAPIPDLPHHHDISHGRADTPARFSLPARHASDASGVAPCSRGPPKPHQRSFDAGRSRLSQELLKARVSWETHDAACQKPGTEPAGATAKTSAKVTARSGKTSVKVSARSVTKAHPRRNRTLGSMQEWAPGWRSGDAAGPEGELRGASVLKVPERIAERQRVIEKKREEGLEVEGAGAAEGAAEAALEQQPDGPVLSPQGGSSEPSPPPLAPLTRRLSPQPTAPGAAANSIGDLAKELSSRTRGAWEAKQLTKDRVLLMLEVPLCTFLALEPLSRLRGSGAAAAAAAVPAAVYWASCVAHAAVVYARPAAAVRLRVAAWAVRLDVALPLLQISRMLLRLQDGQLPPLHGLMLLCAKWGLVDLGDGLFIKCWPHKVLLFLLIHCYQERSSPIHSTDLSMRHLALDAVTFLVASLTAFLLVRAVTIIGARINMWLSRSSSWVRPVATYACILGHGALAMVIMSESLSSLIASQYGFRYKLVALMQELGLESVGSGILAPALTLLAILLLLCTASGLRSAAVGAWAQLTNPRQAWFLQSQLALAGFIEELQHSSGSLTLEAITQALRMVTKPVFGEDLLVKLATIERCPDAGDLTLVTINILHWGYKHAQQGLETRVMPLSTLPSIEYAVTKPSIVMTNDFLSVAPHERVFEDWELHHHTFGARCFLVVPLLFSGHTLGALVVSGTHPHALDKWLRRCVMDIGKQVSSALYTLACQQEMESDKRIIADVYGTSLVIDALKRKSRSLPDHRAGSGASRSSGGDGGGAASPSWRAGETQRSAPGAGGASFESPNSASQSDGGEPSHRRHSSGSADADSDAASAGPLAASPAHVLYQQWHPAVSVLFADIVGYTELSKQLEPEQVMHMLHDLFCRYDRLCTEQGVFKVETIGDCYMAVTGLLVETDDHAQQLVEFGKSILLAASQVVDPLGGALRIRVGIHSGRVMSGIVGSVRARYCLFGDTVNTASRMESTGVPMAIHISHETYDLLPESTRSTFSLRGRIEVKGKGLMSTYLDAGGRHVPLPALGQ